MGKKKGAANKLAKMSEEERIRYLQHRADMEEEARRRKQQLIAIFLKNKLKREEAFTRLNMAKINQEWRTVLRNIKCVELRNEAKNVQTYFMDAFQRKNFTINRLLSELDQQEEMYAKLLNSHIDSIDKLIELHSERLKYWSNQYEEKKQILMEQHVTEMKNYKEKKFKGYKELECVFYSLQTENDAQRSEMEKKHQEKVDDVKSKMMLQLQNITKDREEKMNALWTEFQTILQNYSEKTGDKYAEYVELRERDNEDTKEIHQHYLDISKATRDIVLLKDILESQAHDHQMHMKQLKDYHKLLMDKQKKIKTAMSSSQSVYKKRMKTFVVCSTEMNKKLETLLSRGKNILQLTTMCSKYETDRENLLTFKNLAKTEETAEIINPEDLDDFKQINLHVIAKMEHFWTRFKNVEIDCTCLDKERRVLRKENEAMKEKLKQYIQEVAITNGRIGSTKERLRPKSMKINADCDQYVAATSKKNVDIKRPVTGVEGNLSVAVRSKNLILPKLQTPQIHTYYGY